MENKKENEFDKRRDLIKDISEGIKIRKVEKNEKKEVESVNEMNDVE
jgi:hypothetical protein